MVNGNLEYFILKSVGFDGDKTKLEIEDLEGTKIEEIRDERSNETQRGLVKSSQK